jgi:hypothetical protein
VPDVLSFGIQSWKENSTSSIELFVRFHYLHSRSVQPLISKFRVCHLTISASHSACQLGAGKRTAPLLHFQRLRRSSSVLLSNPLTAIRAPRSWAWHSGAVKGERHFRQRSCRPFLHSLIFQNPSSIFQLLSYVCLRLHALRLGAQKLEGER